jgi:hypothetical protein
MALFYFYVDLALVNSFITFQLVMGSRDMSDQLSFRCSLIESLLAMAIAVQAGPEMPLAVSRDKRSYQSRKQPLPEERLVGMHLPVAVDKQTRCTLCYYKQVVSPTGTVIQGYPKTMCQTCGIHLCIVQGRNCFAEYHTPEE